MLHETYNDAQDVKYEADGLTGGISTGDPALGGVRALLSQDHGEEQALGDGFVINGPVLCDDGGGKTCHAHGHGRSKPTYYLDSYVEAVSDVHVWWDSDYTCTYEQDTYVNVEGSGSVTWWGMDPYDATSVNIKVETYAEGWGIDSVSIGIGFSSESGVEGGGSASISERSSSRIVYEGDFDDVWRINFAYNGGRIYDGQSGSITQVHQGVTGTFTFLGPTPTSRRRSPPPLIPLPSPETSSSARRGQDTTPATGLSPRMGALGLVRSSLRCSSESSSPCAAGEVTRPPSTTAP